MTAKDVVRPRLALTRHVRGLVDHYPSKESDTDVEHTSVFNSPLPGVIDAALAAAGHQPITYRWALLVESIEADQMTLTTLGGGSTRDEALDTTRDLVSLFTRRFTALGGAA